MAAYSKKLLKSTVAPVLDTGIFGVTHTIAVAAADVALGDDVQFYEVPCAMRLHGISVTDDNGTLVASAQLNRGGTRSALTAPADLQAGDILEANIDTDGVGNITLDALLRRK